MSFSARSRLVIVAGALSGVALVLALAIGLQPKRGPELAAPGADHATMSADASRNGPVALANGHFMGGSLKNDTSDRLPNLKQYPAHPLEAEEDEGGDDEDGGEPGPGHEGPNAADTVVQSAPASPAVPATTLNFDGIGFPGVVCNCAPPDTNGEVGQTQYVQIVNEGFEVWSKSTGAKVYGPVGISTIWSGFGGVCETAGHGDPVVLYDQFANRWLVSQFAGASVPTDECVAISTTNDASGSWYRYDFHLGSSFFDYPHLAVWPDGYYMSMNVFNSSGTAFVGAQAFVFDRTRMLQGLSATFQAAPNLGTSSDPILPADVDGSTLPPNGAPESFVRWPGFTGTYQTYHYHVDWVSPANSTFTTFAAPAAAPFSTCGACVPQPGTTSTLDTLDDRLMFRLAYRVINGHEAVVGNYTVFTNGVTGIRWFELRNVTSGPETVAQESTYAPDSTYRWMGSAAMDKNGDIAIGFSASSSTVNPSLRYAARLASDPVNTMGQGEAVLMAGLGSQSGTNSRWGDYADMTVDPVDDCTFWFTSEYYPSGVSSFNWRTRIGSFVLPGCLTPPTTGSISGTVKDTNTNVGVGGATVTLSGTASGSTSTDSSGNFSFSNLNPGGYGVQAAKATYTSGAAVNVTVTAGNNSPANPTLTSTVGAITGTVTSTSGGAVSGATVTLDNGPTTTTTNASGGYTFSAVSPGSHAVTPSKAGFQTASSTPANVSAGVTSTVNLSLTPITTTSGFFWITSSVAGAGGDKNGYEGARSNLVGAPDGALATDASSGKGSSSGCTSSSRDKEVASYNISGVGSTILGIQLTLTGKVNATTANPQFCVQLSWNGGSTWTTGKTTSTLTTSLASYTLGSTSDTWGHAWTAGQLSAANFRVRIIDLTTSSTKTFSLDAVGVKVTYQ